MTNISQQNHEVKRPRIAFYGGSFDPVHIGHLAIAEKVIKLFALDEFNFVPAFHAPHKLGKKVSAAIDRYAMLALATNDLPKVKISTIEMDAPERPFTIETQTKINDLYNGKADIFFVIGADSWLDIKTWRDWESVLTATNIIVVTRPNYDLRFDHIGEEIKAKVTDFRGLQNFELEKEKRIYITDAVNVDVSATGIREKIRKNLDGWQSQVPSEIISYIKKYNLFI